MIRNFKESLPLYTQKNGAKSASSDTDGYYDMGLLSDDEYCDDLTILDVVMRNLKVAGISADDDEVLADIDALAPNDSEGMTIDDAKSIAYKVLDQYGFSPVDHAIDSNDSDDVYFRSGNYHRNMRSTQESQNRAFERVFRECNQ